MKPCNSRGLITLDFLFALVLCLGLSVVLFAWTVTLAVVEVTQYITFSAARSYHAAHLSKEKQIERGNQKYQELLFSPELGSFYRMQWFEVPQDLLEGGIANHDELFGQHESFSEGAPFDGVRIEFNSKILSFRFPFLGQTSDEENYFKTFIGSFLFREPSSNECYEFMNTQNRFKEIKQGLDHRFNNNFINEDAYVLMADNGC